jgi:hypothetical protein
MALERIDIDAAIAAELSNYPVVAQLVQAGDPRILAQLGAQATMLHMMSQQLDVAEVEPFIKARDGTVLADASLKGILPLARGAQVALALHNAGTSSLTLAAGREFQDTKGRIYVLDATITLAPGADVTATASQRTVRTITDNVTDSQPFYRVLVPPSPTGSHLMGIDVSDADGPYTYSPDFVNTAVGSKVFHVETDVFRQVYVRFGADGVTGVQPANGAALTITITECEGEVDVQVGDRFALRYIVLPADNMLSALLDSVPTKGADPHDMAMLRVLTRYASLYDHNVVQLGNFDFYLRQYLLGARFLSVWNEQIEESVRGASVDNINNLFVSYSVPGQSDLITESQIKGWVRLVDSSYKVVFVERVDIEVPLTISAKISVVHEPGQVETQIRNLLLANYSDESPETSVGMIDAFRVNEISDLLRTNVPALQDGISDLQISFGSLPSPLPEQFRYLTDASITVTITRINQRIGLWN